MNHKLLYVCVSFIASSHTFANELLTLDQITVTAEHREQQATKTAATIDVFDANDAAEQRLQSLDDLNNLTSNLSIQQAGRYKVITMRGVGDGGTNVGFDTRVGVYVDGVYMGQAMALGNPIFDIERLEVLKGPQGYLFGNNSNAGVVNILSKQPSHTRERSLTTGVGNYGLFENTLKLNGELSDKLTARLIINNADRNGFVNNQFDGKDLKYLWRFATRAQFKLEATDKLDLTLAADYSHNHQDGFLHQTTTGLFGQPLAAGQGGFNQANFNREPLARVEGHGVQLNADYYLDNDAKLNAIIAMRDWNTKLVTDNDYSASDLIYSDNDDNIRQYSQELRYTSSEDIRWPFVVGLYFLQDQASNDRNVYLGEGVNDSVTLPNAPFPIPFGAAFNIQANATMPLAAQVKSDIKAIYTNIDHRFYDDYVLHLGGRYSIETKQLCYRIDGSQTGRLNMAVVNDERDKIRQTFFSPMIGLSYFLSDNAQLYAKASRAYKSGGWNAEFATTAQFNDGIEYDQESVNAYELGYKHASAHSQLAVALFLNDYQDYQVMQYANFGGPTLSVRLRNAASVKAQGLEINYRRLLGHKWTLDTKLAYLNARYQSFPSGRPSGADADGERLPDAPEFSGSMTVNYQAALPKLSNPVLLSLQNNFQTSTYSGLGDDPETSSLSGRVVVNAYANYTTADERWSWQLWAKNLLNKHYALTRGSDFLQNRITTYGLPRTYGVNGTYHF